MFEDKEPVAYFMGVPIYKREGVPPDTLLFVPEYPDGLEKAIWQDGFSIKIGEKDAAEGN